MHEALTLIDCLSDRDLEWVFSVGVERRMGAGATIVQEGVDSEALHIVLEGLVEIHVQTLDGTLAILGPGELIGEISFLEGGKATASVAAREDTLLLTLASEDLEAQIEADPQFAARLYRALGVIVSRRLRDRVGSLGSLVGGRGDHADPVESHEAWITLSRVLTALKERLNDADKGALQNDGRVPEEVESQIVAEFRAVYELTNELIGEDSAEPLHIREEMGRRVQRELLPYILLSENAERYYAKPRGYAGDFLTIQRMYENRAGGTGRLGPLVDRCILETASAVAVRNRRRLLADEIRREIDRKADAGAKVTTLACGPAIEVFDVYAELDDPARLEATLVDIDFQALAFVGDRVTRAGLQRHMKLKQANLVYLALGKQKLELEPQDLVYSIGLTDYFDDRFVVSLMDYVYGLLAPGGRMILGNFHPRNPVKAFLDYVVDWRLIHRTEADMDRLCAASAFGGPCTRIQFEEQGINLFAECVRSE